MPAESALQVRDAIAAALDGLVLGERHEAEITGFRFQAGNLNLVWTGSSAVFSERWVTVKFDDGVRSGQLHTLAEADDEDAITNFQDGAATPADGDEITVELSDTDGGTPLWTAVLTWGSHGTHHGFNSVGNTHGSLDPTTVVIDTRVFIPVCDDPTTGQFTTPCAFVTPGDPWFDSEGGLRTMGPTITGRDWRWDVLALVSPSDPDRFATVAGIVEEVIAAIDDDESLGGEVDYSEVSSVGPVEPRKIGDKQVQACAVRLKVGT